MKTNTKILMSDLDDSIYRLRAWLRDYGRTKNDVFLQDMRAVLDAASVAGRSEIHSLAADMESCRNSVLSPRVTFDEKG